MRKYSTADVVFVLTMAALAIGAVYTVMAIIPE